MFARVESSARASTRAHAAGAQRDRGTAAANRDEEYDGNEKASTAETPNHDEEEDGDEKACADEKAHEADQEV